MAEPAAVVEQREKFTTKQKILLDAVEAAGGQKNMDFSRSEVLAKLGATDQADAIKKFQELNTEVGHLGADLKRLELKAAAAEIIERQDELQLPSSYRHPDGEGDSWSRKSFGERFIATKEFSDSIRTRQTVPVNLDVNLKTLMTTAAGFAPESTRTGQVVMFPTRPIQVLDLVPTGPISQAVEKYMEQTTATRSAAERAEGATYAESAFVYTEQTSNVRSIGDSIPVTDEQLEDADQISGVLDQQLRFNVMQRIDSQVLVGNGTSPNLRGINNVVGIQTQAKGTESGIVAFLRALTKIRITGRANPNAGVFHPTDWINILLTQSTAGEFLFGNPFQGPGPQQLFGIPIAQSDAQTLGTGLVGDFANFSKLSERKGVTVEIGWSGTQFVEGKKTIRATARVAFTVYRPTAFCQITGL
jgi:HK97 family phage major capsid protein